MAKLAVINRNFKRQAMVKQFAAKRSALQAIMKDPKATDEARDEARAKFHALPATPPPCAFATVAPSRAVLAERSASSVSRATRSVKSPCAGKSRA